MFHLRKTFFFEGGRLFPIFTFLVMSQTDLIWVLQIVKLLPVNNADSLNSCAPHCRCMSGHFTSHSSLQLFVQRKKFLN